jgi:uncharacterized protein (DUF58 family)
MQRLFYRILRVVNRVERLARERLTPAGWVVLATAGGAAIAGVDTNQTMTYQAFTLLAALLVVAFAAGLTFRARARVERALPQYATAGDPVSYRVALTNLGTRPLVGARLAEDFGDLRPDYAEFAAAREPGEERRNWVDRRLGYFRWRWLIERRLPADVTETLLPAIAPGAREERQMSLTPRARGMIEFEGLRLARTDPLGLMNAPRRMPLAAKLVVLPKRYRLPSLAFPGKRKFQPGGVALAASVGDSQEFISLRDYRPGDPLQRVHWKSFARIGKPIVKETQDEFYERHALVLDTAAAGGETAAFEEAVSIAASFVYAVDTSESLLDLLFVGEEVHGYTAGRGQLQTAQMLEVLAAVRASRPEAFSRLAGAALGRRGELSSVIVVLLGWDEERRAFVRALAASGTEVRTLLVCDERDAPAGQAADGLVLHVLHPGRIEAGLAILR